MTTKQILKSLMRDLKETRECIYQILLDTPEDSLSRSSLIYTMKGLSVTIKHLAEATNETKN